MRNRMLMFIAGACCVVAAASSQAATETVTGQVISLSCYYQNHANVGQAGMLCAWATVRYEGNPVGILTSDGKVYQLAGAIVANNNAKLAPLLGKTVSITGDVTEGRGHMPMLTAADAKLSH